MDTAPNVAWIARPCQYVSMQRNPACASFYWTAGRFAPQLVEAMDAAITQIAWAASADRVHLVGYSGGGGMALLVAVRRSDVASVRSVAGNLDIEAFTGLHQVSPMSGSLNPADVALPLAHIPQRHFIGGEDKIVPESIAATYLRRSGNSACVVLQVLPGVTHHKGWEVVWRAQQAVFPRC